MTAVLHAKSRADEELRTLATTLIFPYHITVDIISTALTLLLIFNICLIALKKYWTVMSSPSHCSAITLKGNSFLVLFAWLLDPSVSGLQVAWLYHVTDGQKANEDLNNLKDSDLAYSIISLLIFVEASAQLSSLELCSLGMRCI